MLSRGRVLLGAFDDAERAVAFIERVSTARAGLVRENHAKARQAFRAAPPVERVAPEPLDDVSAAKIEDILRAPLFAQSLGSKRWRLARVPLDALIVVQPLVNLTRVETLAPRVTADPIGTFFPMSTALDVSADAAKGPVISFTSSRGELTVSGAQVRRQPDDGAIEVVFRIEPRPNYVSVLDDGGRLVLRNGHHRVVAAWFSGLRAIPAVVVDGSIDALAARMTSPLSPAELRRDRPPLLVDLASRGAMSLDIDLRAKRHALCLRAQHDTTYEA
jgi:hypothetical protein